MFSIPNRIGQLVTAIALAGATVLYGGTAAADPSQDDQFLALLDKEEIPAVENAASVIAVGHKVCPALDGGMSAEGLVDKLIHNMYRDQPIARSYPRARVVKTMTRFVIAAVEVYCPYDQSKIASVLADGVPGANEPAHWVATYPRNPANPSDLRGFSPVSGTINFSAAWRELTGADAARLSHSMDGDVFLTESFPSGDVTPSNPPHVPAPPPPIAMQPPAKKSPPPPRHHVVPPPRQVAPPPRQVEPPPPQQVEPPPPQQVEPPPPQQVEPPQQVPPPEQVEPPAVGPEPGGAPGSGGGGGIGGNGGGGIGGGGIGGVGGGGPAEPPPAPPAPPMSPGFVRLAP